MNPYCPKCGRFLRNVTAQVNGLDQIIHVEGICKVHRLVDITNQNTWSGDDFEEPPQPPPTNLQ